MNWLARILDFLFGCHHSNLSRVFTIGGDTYQVCWNCGAKFSYSLANMSIERARHTRRLAALPDAHVLRSAR